MRKCRPARATIRLTADERQALEELKYGHGGSLQSVIMEALDRHYRIYDHAQSIGDARRIMEDAQLRLIMDDTPRPPRDAWEREREEASRD